MENPLVTVFIPLFNCENYIGEALESIITQTYSNIEILIIDDGSTDNSVNIVKSFKDSRIRIVKNKENKGIPYSRNLGIKEANGKYMAIMDADDIAFPTRIEKQVRFLENNPGIDAVGSFYKEFGGKFNKVIKPKYRKSNEIKINLIFQNCIGNSTSIIRLETLKKYNLQYNLDYFVAQDYDMWVQISKFGKLSISSDILLKYRTGHLNITKKSKSKKAFQRKKIIDSIHNDILKFYHFNLKTEEMDIFNKYFNDNPQEMFYLSTLDKLQRVLNKMISQNKENEIFEERLFSNILNENVFAFLSKHNLSLPSKIKFYKDICNLTSKTFSIEKFSYLIIKHLYKSVLR